MSMIDFFLEVLDHLVRSTVYHPDSLQIVNPASVITHISGTVSTASIVITTHQAPWIRPHSSQLHIRHCEYGLNNHNYNSGTVNTASSIITHTSGAVKKETYLWPQASQDTASVTPILCTSQALWIRELVKTLAKEHLLSILEKIEVFHNIIRCFLNLFV